MEQKLELLIGFQNKGLVRQKEPLENASSGFQPRFKPDAAIARRNQDAEVADSEAAGSEPE
jgi:hypothetical protein